MISSLNLIIYFGQFRIDLQREKENIRFIAKNNHVVVWKIIEKCVRIEMLQNYKYSWPVSIVETRMDKCE